MIDLKDLRERPNDYQRACELKRIKFDVNNFLKLDEEYRAKKTEVEQQRAEQNRVSKLIPTLKGADKERELEGMKALVSGLKSCEQSLKELEQEWERQQRLIPSIPAANVPTGKDDSDNVEIKRWGTPPKFDFEPRDHVTLGKSLGIIDIERATKVAGARNYFLVGDGARLQHAVLQLALDLLGKRGYLAVDCPHIVLYDAMEGTGYFPGGEEMAYHLDDRDANHYLIGTSEVSVCSMRMQELLDYSELPLRYAGYSPCYRREAGSYGKDTQGLYRVHQFYKIEQVIICANDVAESARMHAELLKNSEDVMQLLELPYRVVDVCTGDMGQGQVYKNDIETWMPSRSAYGETHSCSTFLEFQARRLGMRYKTPNGEKKFCHTLNNTCIASPRVLIPLIEVHQQADGTIKIPAALRPYMNNQELIVPRA